ncbi:VIR-like CYIR protein, partial [Plasmodium cynomolgi strain B]
MAQKRLIDTAIISSLQDEYRTLDIWPKLNASKLLKVYNNYDSLCKEINSQSSGSVENDVCMAFFGYVEDVVRGEHHDTLRGIYDDFVKLNYSEPVSYGVYSQHLTNFLYYFKKVAKKKMMKNINMIKELYEDNDLLKGIVKLFYFSENVAGIREKLSSHDHADYKKTCEFVNDCIDVYRDFLNYTCPPEYYDRLTNSTVCNELHVFFDNYDKILYRPLKSHNRFGSLRDYPDTARVRCDLDESLYKSYPT